MTFYNAPPVEVRGGLSGSRPAAPTNAFQLWVDTDTLAMYKSRLVAGSGLLWVVVDQPVVIPALPNLGSAILTHELPINTAGGATVTTTWTQLPLNTEVSDLGNIVTLASNRFKPIAGVYDLLVNKEFSTGTANITGRLRLFNATTSVAGVRGRNARSGAANGPMLTSLQAVFAANGTDEYEIQYRVSTGTATNGLGVALNVTGENENYMQLTLKRTGD